MGLIDFQVNGLFEDGFDSAPLGDIVPERSEW